MIKYKGGYKYQLVEEYTVKTSIFPAYEIITEYIALSLDGVMIIKQSYAWDGPSGPTYDSINFMRGSLVHDAFYQLMREGHLHSSLRDHADRELQRMCIEDGMWRIRAWWVYQGVKLGGAKSVTPEAIKKIFTAP